MGISCSGCRDEGRYPNRPLTLVCPWSKGGGTDTVSRQIAALLETELEIPVNVINATGGSGVTGHTRGALAKPDGYTLTMITVELNMLRWRGLAKVGYEDFDPLILVNRDAAALFVRANAPWQSLDELQRAIRANPRSFKASGTAQGGIWHVAVAGWLDHIGLQASDVIWVSLNGAGPSLQELLSGGVDFICCSLPEAAALMEGGRIRSLGVMAPERVAAYSDVPAFAEQGVDWSMGGWRGLALPNGVPEDRKQTLLAALRRVIEREEYRDFMSRNGFEARGDGPAEFAAALAGHDREFREILESEAYQSVRRARYGPMAFPAVIGGGLLVVAVLMLVMRSGKPAADALWQSSLLHLVLLCVGVLVFVMALDWLGFVLTAVLFLVLMMRYLGARLPVAVATSVLVAVATYQLFAIQFRVSLPWGLLGW